MTFVECLHELILKTGGDAAQCVQQVQALFGGQNVYVHTPDNSARNQAIKKAFTGNNHDEVCKRFDINRRTLYRILRNE